MCGVAEIRDDTIRRCTVADGYSFNCIVGAGSEVRHDCSCCRTLVAIDESIRANSWLGRDCILM